MKKILAEARNCKFEHIPTSNYLIEHASFIPMAAGGSSSSISLNGWSI